MLQVGADFVITGEVLGQRPMSQHRRALQLLERESELEGLLLRPLSARLLSRTIPEIQGWVDRDRLYAFAGRSRKPQIRLAEELGLEEYPQPAGGCLLTDENYARRFRDLVAHTDIETLTPKDMMLLAIGRHFRVSERAKCIVGREEAENNYLDRAQAARGRMAARDHMGPVTLVEGEPSDEDKRTIAGITARYSDGKDEPSVAVVYESEGKRETLWIKPKALQEAHEFMI
jgi:tRNA U34 2-thiouridine synthase MnmA/TrmU